MLKDYIKEIYVNNKGKANGAIIGLLIGLFMLMIGFFKTLFLIICILIGFYIGKKIDNRESLYSIIERFLPDEWK